MTDQSDTIERINALTNNARNTWFALLGVLVFVGITLMRVEHIDFYGVGRETKLPLVDVSVPTRAFFVAAPVLTTAIYGYFHLYLIRLWDALGSAPAEIKGRPLGDVITPWLVTDAALHMRARRRNDACASPRTLEAAAKVLNLLLAWGFGLAIVGWLWLQSMTARNFHLSALSGICLLIALYAGASSLAMLRIRTGKKIPHHQTPELWFSLPALTFFFALCPGILLFTGIRTEGPSHLLAPITLIDEAIVERPAGWLPYDIARDEYRDTWCKRKSLSPCPDRFAQDDAFTTDWRTRRDTALYDMRRPDWHKRTPNWWVNKEKGKHKETFNSQKPDFRNADLSKAFLPGTNLQGAQMAGADLSGALMEGADLRGALMDGANLTGTRVERANLEGARMERANLKGAWMEGAKLLGAHMTGAKLPGARMTGAQLLGAQMESADLLWAQMDGAFLLGAQMEGAVLIGAQMERVVLAGATMEKANLSGALLSGSADHVMVLTSTNLKASTDRGGALRFVDLRPAIFDSETDFRNAFLDGTVQMSDTFRARMGNPCHWEKLKNIRLNDEEFFSLWRWWLKDKLQNNMMMMFTAGPLQNALPASSELIAKYDLTDCSPS